MSRILTLLLFLFLFNYSFGQGTAVNAQSYTPNVFPPSPNAAALEKFTTIPIDYSTGIPSISYPMWSWHRNSLTFNLGLSYHAGGIKVDDMASDVGIGWVLNGLGSVTRTVRGLPDDDQSHGFIHTPNLPFAETYHYSSGYYFTSPFIVSQQGTPITEAITPLNSPYSDLIKQIDDKTLDGEQDIFSYSAGNCSGRFILDKDKNVVSLERTNTKIEIKFNSTGYISSFNIIDDKGILYRFEHQETQYALTQTNPTSFQTISSPNYVSGWLLTKIINQVTKDSIVINYLDNASGVKYETSFSESKSFKVDNALVPESNSTSFCEITGNDPVPQSINFPDGSLVNFDYDFSRADYVNAKALTKVSILNYQNVLIKRFLLNYSYFLSGQGGYFPIWSASGNDFNKRLKLDKVDEIAINGNSLKTTAFIYNVTPLNPRSSKNIDFWGYNVNPSRNNLSYIPVLILQDQEKAVNPNTGAIIDGANRVSDEDFVKAGTLEKIIYPTGGFTSFEYECHKAFSPIDYYVNELNGNSPEWLKNDFGQNKSLIFPSRENVTIEFNFKTEEFVPRPVPDPNHPQSCLEDGQDLEPASFEISSVSGTVPTITVNNTYGNFLAGITKTISLPIGESYLIKFIYNADATCAYSYPFKAVVTSKYLTAPHDKLVGGLRIKKITSESGTGKLLTKEYNYNNTDGNSSATLTTIPDYGYYRTGLDESSSPPGPSYILLTRHIQANSNPSNTLNFFNGSPVVYTKVTELESDGSSTERLYDPLIFGPTGGPVDRVPYVPIQDFNNLSGLLLSETIKDNTGLKKAEKIFTYNKFSNYLLNQDKDRNIKTALISSSVGTANSPYNYNAKYYIDYQYWMYVTDCKLISTQKNIFEGANVLSELEINSYEPIHNYLKSTKTTTSKNEVHQKLFNYIFETGSNSAYTTMEQNNMLNYLFSTQFSKSPFGGNDALSENRTNYQLFQNSLLPMPATIQSSLLGNDLKTEITFNDYDGKGNMLQYTANNGIITSFIWGYNKQYPVAKVIGKTYADILSQSLIDMAIVNNPVNDAALRNELNKLRTLAGCEVTTFTYQPLVGLTSQSDVNNRITYYEYDDYERLKLIRDQDNNIIKRFDYQYQQPQ